MKERLTGAVVLVLLAVIVIPLILDDSRVVEPRITTTNIPEKPDEEFTTRLLPIPEPDEVFPAEEEAEEASPAPARTGGADTAVMGEAEEPGPAAAAEIEAEVMAEEAGAGAEVEVAGLTGWVVQVGGFSRENADSLNERLRAAGYSSYVVDEPVRAGDGALLYRVRVGPEVLQSEALKLKAKLKKDMDLDGFVLNYP